MRAVLDEATDVDGPAEGVIDSPAVVVRPLELKACPAVCAIEAALVSKPESRPATDPGIGGSL